MIITEFGRIAGILRILLNLETHKTIYLEEAMGRQLGAGGITISNYIVNSKTKNSMV
jgi:hypothetical protein